MSDQTPDAPSALLLSDDEKRALQLHDRLQQLQLEIALLTAQKNYVPSASSSSENDDVEAALLDSRSRYVLRNGVVESVVTANPILQAVHGGSNASPVEKDLLPILEQRDESASTQAHQSAESRALLDEITEVESRSLRLGRENADLAARVLELAGQAAQRKAAAVEADPERAAEIARLEGQVRLSRQRWRVLKETAAAVVVGSGVDWARRPELRDVVLDPEDEDGA
ncbi:centromere protein H (CENP-H)-domain-containing protein [Xylariaceae sp. FL0662B]|nr:centromere protein H (CENP-H)-domain-containing protein [Xylariaceae sp. FL0662B]